jgi:hypothetical protein
MTSSSVNVSTTAVCARCHRRQRPECGGQHKRYEVDKSREARPRIYACEERYGGGALKRGSTSCRSVNQEPPILSFREERMSGVVKL